MRRGEDTPKRELLNLIVWVMPALILSEDDAGMELDKEYYSRSAGLNRRLAAAEKDEWDDLVEKHTGNNKRKKKLTSERRTEQSSRRTMRSWEVQSRICWEANKQHQVRRRRSSDKRRFWRMTCLSSNGRR